MIMHSMKSSCSHKCASIARRSWYLVQSIRSNYSSDSLHTVKLAKRGCLVATGDLLVDLGVESLVDGVVLVGRDAGGGTDLVGLCKGKGMSV